jgi:hypothetical protein
MRSLSLKTPAPWWIAVCTFLGAGRPDRLSAGEPGIDLRGGREGGEPEMRAPNREVG